MDSNIDIAELKRRIPSDMERFMSKVIPEPNSGCWLWAGTTVRQGYAGFWDSHLRKNVTASRWIYEKITGQSLDGLEACHKCDVPCCVNPQHLFAGTHRENMLDAIRKGRVVLPPPETIGYKSKLTHCKNGHPFNANSKVTLRSGVSQRRCFICNAKSQEKYQAAINSDPMRLEEKKEKDRVRAKLKYWERKSNPPNYMLLPAPPEAAR